jgi:hypothetical protein
VAVHDDDVWLWYGNERPCLEQVQQWAKSSGDPWRLHGGHKWIAYDRRTGVCVSAVAWWVTASARHPCSAEQ